jgi:uncharacterized protein YbjT (DUF2867 family)
VVRGLAEAGREVRAATRDPAGARGRTWAGRVRPVAFDFEAPDTWGPALEGVERLFLMARPGDDDADRHSIPFVDAAVRRGVRRVVALSALGVERLPGMALRKIEVHVEASGLEWTFLRPNFFMQIFSTGSLQAGIRATGTISVPSADARLSWIDARDIAEVGVRALVGDDLVGRALALTGSESLDHASVAAAIARATGREVRYLPVDEDASRAALERIGLPPARIARLLGFYRLVRAGACAPVLPDLADALGRPPVTFERFAADHAGCWA